MPSGYSGIQLWDDDKHLDGYCRTTDRGAVLVTEELLSGARLLRGMAFITVGAACISDGSTTVVGRSDLVGAAGMVLGAGLRTCHQLRTSQAIKNPHQKICEHNNLACFSWVLVINLPMT
jgi:hypothetical protein